MADEVEANPDTFGVPPDALFVSALNTFPRGSSDAALGGESSAAFSLKYATAFVRNASVAQYTLSTALVMRGREVDAILPAMFETVETACMTGEGGGGSATARLMEPAFSFESVMT